jgi:hypothetical protein
MFLVHAHFSIADANDYYWSFDTHQESFDKVKDMLSNYSINDLDIDMYQEIYSNHNDIEDIDPSDSSFQSYLKQLLASPENVTWLNNDDHISIIHMPEGYGYRL